MGLNFEKLSDQLEQLLHETLGTEYLINSFYRISKATPEQTKPYFLLKHNIPRPIIILVHLIQIPLNLIKLTCGLVLGLIFRYQHGIFESKIRNQKILFLSHGTNGNIFDPDKDRFFDLLPEEILSQRQIPCTIIYTNQNIFGFQRNLNLLKKKNININHVLLPKFLKFGENLNFILYINFLMLKCLYFGIKIYFDSPSESRILLASISTFFNRKTYTNYLLRERLRDFYQGKSVTSIFLTFEGHSFEQILIDDALKHEKRLNIYLYQHSPIVPFHFGIKKHLQNLSNRVNILTTGQFYQDYFQSISNKPNFIVLGTNKIDNIIKHSSSNGNSILYAPEGTSQATLDSIKLIHKLIFEIPEYDHVLRLHPDLKETIKIKVLLSRLNKSGNFILSDVELTDNLSSCRFLIYRSSAVGIQSLNYETVPIFYSQHHLDGLNVLFKYTEHFHVARNMTEVLSLIRSEPVALSIEAKQVILGEMFTAIKYQIVSELNLI